MGPKDCGSKVRTGLFRAVCGFDGYDEVVPLHPELQLRLVRSLPKAARLGHLCDSTFLRLLCLSYTTQRAYMETVDLHMSIHGECGFGGRRDFLSQSVTWTSLITSRICVITIVPGKASNLELDRGFLRDFKTA